MIKAKIFYLAFFLIFLSGCDMGLRQMQATEYGVVYRNLPTFLGGGIASKVHEPGSLALVWPWEELIRIDTAVKELSWSFKSNPPSYIPARALDGNEVALAVSMRYQIKASKEALTNFVNRVGTLTEETELLVKNALTADVRLYMNELHTSEFLKTESRYRAVDKIKNNLQEKLNDYNIQIISVNLDDFRFERTLDDGKIDASYQDKLNETQRIREEIEREKARVDTVIAQKQQEYNDELAKVNRVIAEAEGYKKQATSRGDAYLKAKSNEAEGILAVGQAEAQGLEEKVKALSGTGGRALLKLDIAKSLMSSDPKFFLLGGKDNLEVRRTDTNDILRTLGLIESMQTSNNLGNQKRKEKNKTNK